MSKEVQKTNVANNIEGILLNSFLQGRLTLIGGRPWMGKTSLALSTGIFASNVFNTTVLYISLNENTKKIEEKIKKQRLCFDKNKFIITSPRSKPNLKDIAGFCENTNKLELVIIDYFLLINLLEEKSETERFDKLLLAIKELSDNNNYSVLITHPINRNIQFRENKTPELNDLRVSPNSIQNHVDTIFTIHNESVFSGIGSEATMSCLKGCDNGKSFSIKWDKHKLLFYMSI